MTTNAPDRQSWPAASSHAARASFGLAIVGFGLLWLGPLGSTLGMLSPLFGFTMALGSVPLALLSLLLGLVGLYHTRASKGLRGRSRAWIGVGYGVITLLLVIMTLALRPGVPRINDVTTDLSDPPRFSAIAELEENRDRDLSYPLSFSTEQKKGYPGLAPIVLEEPPERALQRALSAARALGWRIVATQPERGLFEATAQSRVFHFVDYVVVRIRAHESGGSVVDVRSKSRDGKGDLGVNAARIHAFVAELRGR